MPLVNMTTNLKSLRYGKDTVGGGSSNQPYIVAKIPDDLSDVGRTGGPDFLLRGGTLLPKIIARDVSRMTQMFFDFKSPNGPLFVAKQNVLSLTNVNSEVGYVNTDPTPTTTNNALGAIGQFIKDNIPLNQGLYTPLSTIGQSATNPLGIHLVKQGFNPLLNTTVSSPDGNTPLGLPTYLNTIYTNSNDGNKSRVFSLLNKIDNNTGADLELYSYSGGPGATLGVGKTKIRMYDDQRTGINNKNKSFFSNKLTPQFVENSKIFLGKDEFNNPPFSLSFLAPQLIYSSFDPVIASELFREDYIDFRTDSVYQPGTLLKTDTNKLRSGTGTGIGPQVFTQQQIEEYGVNKKNPLLSYEPTSKDSLFNKPSFTTVIAPSGSQEIPAYLDYTKKNIESRVNLGDPGRRGNLSSYTIGKREINTNSPDSALLNERGALDKITALPIYQSSGVTGNTVKNDLVKFRIGVIDNDNPSLKTYIHFRAFIDSFSDTYSADWKANSYMGRGEKFYKYSGFDRTVSMAWTVAAQSKQELIPMYQKLNYLASVCAPDYSDAGYMRGNLVTLTVGGYFQEQVGIMTGLNFDIPQESPWEIAIPDNNNILTTGAEGNEIFTDPSVKEMPLIVKVTGFNFIPIHDFVPRVQQNSFANGKPVGSGGTFVGKYGKEHYINLAAGSGNNYDGQGDNLNYIPKK